MGERDTWRTLARFARAHDVRGIVIAFALIAVCDAVLGSMLLQLPYTASESGVPFRRELPLALASVTAASLAGPMHRFEETAAAGFRRTQLAWVGGVAAAAAALLTGDELIISPPATAVALLRGLLIWIGLALLSGRVLGWRLSFVLPLASIFPLTYWPYDAQGHNRWWDWTHQPASAWPCWAIAATALATGCTALLLTPWRTARAATHGLPRRRRRSITDRGGRPPRR